jgi:hypothetical protein
MMNLTCSLSEENLNLIRNVQYLSTYISVIGFLLCNFLNKINYR